MSTYFFWCLGTILLAQASKVILSSACIMQDNSIFNSCRIKNMFNPTNSQKARDLVYLETWSLRHHKWNVQNMQICILKYICVYIHIKYIIQKERERELKFKIERKNHILPFDIEKQKSELPELTVVKGINRQCAGGRACAACQLVAKSHNLGASICLFYPNSKGVIKNVSQFGKYIYYLSPFHLILRQFLENILFLWR